MKEAEEKAWVKPILIVAFMSLAGTWWTWKHQTAQDLSQVKHLEISTTNPPAGMNVLPEQRRKFALGFEKFFKAKGMDATVTTTGDFHTKVLVRGSIVNEPLVLQIKDSAHVVNDLRDMGFKHLIMTDGKSGWDVNLRN